MFGTALLEIAEDKLLDVYAKVETARRFALPLLTHTAPIGVPAPGDYQWQCHGNQ